MVFPDYVTTRAVTAGGAFTLESADLLKVRLTVTASKSLVRDENGVRFERRPLTATSELGSEVSIALPVTDQSGWRDAGTGALIDVTAPDSFTHKYTALLELIDDQGRVLAGGQVRLGPFVVPTGDLTPIDLDKTVPTSTVAGEQVSVPDLWGQLVAAATQAAEDAASAVGPVAARVTNVEEDLDTRLSDPALTAKIAERAGVVRSIYEFVLPGETLTLDGTGTNHIILQRAVDALSAEYLADSGAFGKLGRLIQLPAGIIGYDTNVTWKTGVGMLGAGAGATTLAPRGIACGIFGNQGGSLGFWYEDVTFKDFTIECSGQASTPANSSVKGIFMQFLRRARFENIIIRNSWMTGFGLDYFDAEGGVFINCEATGAGRGGTNTSGAGAGFGIATGFSAVETCRIINCSSNNNKTHGFFTENKWTAAYEASPPSPSYPIRWSRGFTLTGCTAIGNQSGFCDAGSQGAAVSDCQFLNNIGPGVLIGRTPANASGGKDGRITGCTMTGNESGVEIVELAVGGYTIENNDIFDNAMYGISRSTPAGAIREITQPLRIHRNRICRNGRSGIRFASASPVSFLSIKNNDIFDNGKDTAASYRDGITIHSPLYCPEITDNRIFNTQGITGPQQRAIYLRDAVTSVSPVIQRNDVRFNAATATERIRVGHTVADTSLVTGNITTDPATPPVAPTGWTDAFTRADTTAGIGSTETGGKVWVGSSGATGGISGNRAYVGGTTSVTRTQVVDGGTSVGTYVITVATVDTRRGRTVVRGGGPDVTTAIHLKHRTSSSDNRYQVATVSGATDTLVFQSEVLSADGDVHEITQAANGDVVIKVNGVVLWSGNIPYSTVPDSPRVGIAGDSNTLGTLYDNASFTPA